MNNGWIEYAYDYLVGGAYGSLSARWDAPPKPQGSYSGNQVYYTFPGLESTQFIVQPVLQYHWDGGQRWTGASWHCDDGSHCTHGTVISVDPVDEILGTVTASDCQGGQCWWTIITRDLTRQTQSTWTVEDTEAFFWATGGAVEVYGLTSCSQYPDSAVNYYAVTLHDEDGDPVSPTWTEYVAPGLSPECEFDVASTTSTVSLYHDPTPPPPPPPPMSVTINGPSTWPAYQVVTVQALVSNGTSPFVYTWRVNGAPYAGCRNKSWCSKAMGGPGTSVYFWVKVTDADADEATDYRIVLAQ